MTPLATTLWLVNITLDTFGQMAFKAGATGVDAEGALSRWNGLLSNPWVLFGILAYVLEFLVWLSFLTIMPLSQGVLMGSVNILVVMFAGAWFFHEALTKKRVIACLLIAAGVGLVGWA